MSQPATLLAELEAAAAELPDAATRAAEDGTSWVRGGRRFALLRGATVELRVGSAIAAAAVRTPDTTHSQQGPDWIAFAPASIDDRARDRLRAWLAAAHRRALD